MSKSRVPSLVFLGLSSYARCTRQTSDRRQTSDICQTKSSLIASALWERRHNNGVKYILVVIDVFSKYGWMVPIKTKTGVEVANTLEVIFKERKPEKLWVDKGREFYNREVQKLITSYSTENEKKSSVAERWNRTMKEKMFKYFSANFTRKCIDILDQLVVEYNNTKHTSIGMTLKEASQKENEAGVWRNLYGNYDPPSLPKHKTPKAIR